MFNGMMARSARISDAAAIARIYNQGIEDRVATFETRLRSASHIEQWFDGIRSGRATLIYAHFRVSAAKQMPM